MVLQEMEERLGIHTADRPGLWIRSVVPIFSYLWLSKLLLTDLNERCGSWKKIALALGCSLIMVTMVVDLCRGNAIMKSLSCKAHCCLEVISILAIPIFVGIQSKFRNKVIKQSRERQMEFAVPMIGSLLQ